MRRVVVPEIASSNLVRHPIIKIRKPRGFSLFCYDTGMSSEERLLAKYPDAEIVETEIEIDEVNFAAQVNKNTARNAEGGAIGIVWIGKTAIVLVRRTGMHSGWSLPGGTVENGEDFDAAFMRETEEETSVAATINRLLLLDKRVFVSPSGQKYAMNLAIFEATAGLDQTAVTTDLAKEEELEVGVFEYTSLPETMIFKDKERIEAAILNR